MGLFMRRRTSAVVRESQPSSHRTIEGGHSAMSRSSDYDSLSEGLGSDFAILTHLRWKSAPDLATRHPAVADVVIRARVPVTGEIIEAHTGCAGRSCRSYRLQAWARRRQKRCAA